jgi:dephospho-CoA kinase
MSTVIVLAGLPGSGKSEASEIAKLMGIPVIIMGDVIRSETAKRGLKPNSQNIGLVATELRAKNGDDVVLQRSWPKISEALSKHNIVMIDGMRSIAEKDALVELMGKKPEILAIIASEEIRNLRLIGRGRSDDMKAEKVTNNTNKVGKENSNIMPISGVSERDKREKGWGVEELLEEANFKIVNEDSVESFRINVKELLEGLNYSN